MPNETVGTFMMGRWGPKKLFSRVEWLSDASDPYGYILFPHDTNTALQPKAIMAEFGNDYMFDLIDGSRGTLDDAVKLCEYGNKASADLNLFVEFYKNKIFSKSLFSATHHGLVAAGRGVDGLSICISPSCHYMEIGSGPITECESCGRYTSIPIVEEPDIPDGCIHNLSPVHIRKLLVSSTMIDRIIELSNNDTVRLIADRSRMMLSIDTNIPQLRAKGDHFIRARVNRAVLGDSGHNIPAEANWLIPIIGLNRSNTELIIRLLEDESILLDPSRADAFREEYIDEQWSEEYIKFVSLLRKSGTLKVDSAGLHETLTALYNMVQNSAGLRSIIKKSGEVVFPTTSVLENTNTRLIVQAFNATEHNAYETIGDVFVIEEG